MTEKGRTLWDRLTGANKPIPNEDKYSNPFKARIGNSFHLDILGQRGVFWTLKSIEVIDRGTTTITDYRLESKPFGSSDNQTLLLRVLPRDGKTGVNKIDFRIVALSPYYQCGWNDDARPGIMEGVNDPAGEFVINANTPDERKFWRLHGLKDPYSCNVTILEDDSGDGVVQDEEIKHLNMEMWDFSRTTLDVAQQEYDEYLYVQKNTQTGWLEVLTGTEIPPERINI